MRKYIIYIASFIGSALLQTSCYDDKGDYDYHDVNMMEIVIPEIKLRMPKEEAVEVLFTFCVSTPAFWASSV